MRGTTLVETLLALSLLVVLGGLALPGAIGLRDRLLVERHAARIIEGYERARVTALLSGGPVLLEVAPESIAVYLPQAGDTLPAWRVNGPASDGVELLATQRWVQVGPHALSLGVANGRFELRRGGISRAVVASRPGRLRVERRPHRRRARRRDRREPRCRGAS